MHDQPTEQELRTRIEKSIRFHGGYLPPVSTAVWNGYLAALLEWNLISVSTHAKLVDLLPQLDSNPIKEILVGWHHDEEK